MKKIKKIIINFVLIFSIALVSINPCMQAYAFTQIEYKDFSEWTLDDLMALIIHLSCGLGCLFLSDYAGTSECWDTLTEYFEEHIYIDRENNGLQVLNDSLSYDENGNIVASDAFMDALKAFCDAYINSQTGGSVTTGDYGDYYIIKTPSYSKIWEYVNSFNSGWNTERRTSLMNVLNTNDVVYFYYYNNSNYIYQWYVNIAPLELEDLYYMYDVTSSQGTYGEYIDLNIVDENGAVSDRDMNGVKIYPLSEDAIDGTFSRTYGETTYRIFLNYDMPVALSRHIFTRNGENIRVWKNESKLGAFLTGTGTTNNYAVTSNYINYDASIDNSITVNQSTINNIQNNYNSYQEEINQTINNINNYNTSNVTYNEYQSYVDNSVTNIINNYYISDGTGGGDGSVSGNSPTIDSDAFYDEDGNSWFEQIKLVLDDILDKLKEIKNVLIGDMVADAGQSIAKLFLDLKDGIADMVDNATDLIPDVADLAGELVEVGEEKIGDIVGDIGTTFTPTGELLKTKFPFCIPWDLIAIVTVMAADPVAPVYEFPFVIESISFSHTVVLDMSILEPVASICRTMLTLIFILILIHITIKLTSKGSDDE